MPTRFPFRPLTGLAAVALLASAVPAADDLRFFEAKVRPLLAEKCVKCHGPSKQKSDLRLDTAAGVRKGGESGHPLVVPGKPDAGALLAAVRHADGAPAMPPDDKLKASEVAILAAWVKAGAPFPAPTEPAPEPEKHWAFQPVKAVTPTGNGHPIDRFIRARLGDSGLTPAPLADKRTLIRRATFDLTGLPPTPEEIDAFLKDDGPAAWEKVIDRLLASPAYGERWGRHWLDVARYADSNGLDENLAHGNAWRYRDYVIASVNADKPFDRFIKEQVAGDLLPTKTPAARHEQLIATGFLAIGPKVLAEPDEKKMEFDIVDEQVDTVGRAVLGMTFGCARCHDHKFDPITAADYYALAGVFVSTKTMDSFKKVARWHEHSLASPAELKRKADHDAAVAKLKAKAKELAGKKDDAAKAEAKKLQAEITAMEKAAPEPSSAMGVADGKPTDVPVLRRGSHLNPGTVVARRFPVVLAGAKQAALPTDHSGRLELANWLASPTNPLTARVAVNRVWRWHFGAGLVRSVDNFGLLGEKPTHPELLDWLAAQFATDGWSLKKLHRRIMTSATYRMSSSSPQSADPDNRLLAHAAVRRLEVEAIRDSLLAVGGLLDRTAGGPVFTHVKNREFLFDHTSKDQTTYGSKRRAVYLPVVRNNLYDVFQLFDAPDPAVPTGDRSTTTVATQALFFLNSPLVIESADALAGRLLAGADLDDAGRVRRLFALALGRPPTAAECERLLAGVATFETEFAGLDADKRRRKAWATVCQAVLASNEFVHLQ